MSVEKYFTIRCNECGRTDGPNDESEIGLRESLKILKDQGWKHWNATGIAPASNLCPDCVPKPAPKPVDPRQQDLFQLEA